MPGTLATLIAERRSALGYTMRGLATRIGVSSAYIAHIEHGRIDTPSPPVLAALARELHISEVTLLQAIGYMQSPAATPGEVVGPAPSLAHLIKQAREARGMTQVQVDEAIGMSTGYTGMVESNRITRPRAETLRKLENVLGIAREDMLVATGELDTPSDDASVMLQRIATLPNREQRLEAWATLPEGLRSATLVLMQDVLLAGAQCVWDGNNVQREESRAVGDITPVKRS